jgi:hypothetical protein
MKHTKASKILLVLFAVVLCFGPVGLADPLGTAFTYQGRLIDANQAANALYDFQFKLFDANSGGNKLGADVNKPEVDVIDSYFTVELDFGSVFDGNNRWLEIGVRPGVQNDPNIYTTLSPRQRVTPAPYALYAKNGAGAGDLLWQVNGTSIYYNNGNVGIGTTSPVAKLSVNGDISAGSVYKINGVTVLSFSGTSNTLVGVNAGPATTTGRDNAFLGTAAGLYNTTGGSNTFLGSNAGLYNTTGGDNTFSGFQAGYSNTTGNYNTFSGIYAGHSNTTGGSNTFSGYYAGYSNTTGQANIFLGEVAGYQNTTGNYNTCLGSYAGHDNATGSGNVFLGYKAGYNETGSNKLYIANSDVNKLIYGDFSAGTVGIGTTSPAAKLDVAGDINVASDYKIDGNTVLSVPGTGNTLVGVGAGAVNTGICNTFTGMEAGLYNTTGGYNTFSGYLAGNGNITGGSNTFSGSTAGRYNTTGNANTFLGAMAGSSNTTGGENTFSGSGAGSSNNTGSGNTFSGSGAGHSNTTGFFNTFSGNEAGYSNTAGNRNTYSGFGAGYYNTGSGNVFIGYKAGYSYGGSGSDKLFIANADAIPLIYGDFSANTLGFGTMVIPTGCAINTATGAYLTTGGTWTNYSSRDVKENITLVDARQVLEKLVKVPVSIWNYRAEDKSTHHMGPMAQDLYGAFELGDSDKSIATIDGDGISFAAIQGLYQIVKEKDAAIESLNKKNEQLEARLAAMESIVSKLSQQEGGIK